jgi:hypothetical protein
MKTRVGLFSVVMVLFCVGTKAQDAPSGAFAGLVSVAASLKSTVSSKDAKVGQVVIATVEIPATVNGTALGRGTQILGHVVDVTKHTKESPDGSLTILFDEVKPKKGDAMKIRASIFRIMPSENMMLAQRTDASSGMRGTQNDVNTAVMRQNENTVHATQSADGAPVQVVSGIGGVALSAVANDDKSGIMTAKNKDVELPVSMDMVIGVALKQ